MLWLIGLSFGLAIGGAYSSGAAGFGAVLGAIAGLIADATRRAERAAQEKRLEDTDKKLLYLYDQFLALEKRVARLAADTATSPAPESATAAARQAAALSPATQQPQRGEPPPRPSVDAAPASAATAALDYRRMPQPPTAPAGPSLWRRLLAGNILAKIGVMLLFFGVASALKLAVEHGLFPIQLRLLLGSVAGVAMILFGWSRRDHPTHRTFGLALQGGGFAVLYLIVYFALERYQMIDRAPAFALFAVLGVACIVLAAKQEGAVLAVLGMSGAFLAPMLAARGGGSHIALFSYFSLLNGFIIAVSAVKGWRSLNVAGFLFTFLVGLAWAQSSYTPEHYASTQAFLLVFFVMYSTAPVVFALMRVPGAKAWVDALLIFGTPIAAILLQVPLVEEFEYGLAWSAFGASLYYFALWLVLERRNDAEVGLLQASHLALGVGFLTVAVPLAFGVQVTAAFWAIEGVAIIWFGVRQQRALAQCFAQCIGMAVQLAAGGYFLLRWWDLSRMAPILNDVFVGGMIIAAAGFVSAHMLRPDAVKPAATIPAALPLYWGLLWWFGSGVSEIVEFLPARHELAAALLFATASCALAEALGRAARWLALRGVAFFTLPLSMVVAVVSVLRDTHVLAGFMSIAFPLAMAAHYWMLSRQDADGIETLARPRHLGGYWLLAAVAGRELAWAAHSVAPGITLWPLLAWGVAGVVFLATATLGVRKGSWPFAARPRDYVLIGALPLVFGLMLWSLYANFTHAGGGAGLPYVPLLNPFDLVHIAVFAALRSWWRSAEDRPPVSFHSLIRASTFALTFIWVSAMAARIAHHWGGVPFEVDALLRSVLLQALLTLLWTGTAIGLMILSTRALRRDLWYGGFALLAVVGVKLLFIDLANAGTATWTASLIGVALLVLAASYFAPMPPPMTAES